MQDSHAASRRLLVGLILFAASVCAIARSSSPVRRRPTAPWGAVAAATVHQPFTHTLTGDAAERGDGDERSERDQLPGR